MNPEIKTLLLQVAPRAGEDGEYLPSLHTSEDIENFARLVVFECVNAVMDGTKEGDHYAQRIEQHFDNGPGGILHFGVKE